MSYTAAAVFHCRELLDEILSYVRPVLYIEPTVNIRVDEERKERVWIIDLKLFLWNKKRRCFVQVGVDNGIQRWINYPTCFSRTMVEWIVPFNKYIWFNCLQYRTYVDLLSYCYYDGEYYLKIPCDIRRLNYNKKNYSNYDDYYANLFMSSTKITTSNNLDKQERIKECIEDCVDIMQEHVLVKVSEYDAKWSMKYMSQIIEQACDAKLTRQPLTALAKK